MDSMLIVHARKVRLILTAWLLFVLTLCVVNIPVIGLLAGWMFGLLTIWYGLRLVCNARWIQGCGIIFLTVFVLVDPPGRKQEWTNKKEHIGHRTASKPAPRPQHQRSTRDYTSNPSAQPRRTDPRYENPFSPDNAGKTGSLPSPPAAPKEKEDLESFIHRYLKTFKARQMNALLSCYADTVWFNGSSVSKRSINPVLQRYWEYPSTVPLADDYDLDSSKFGAIDWKVSVIEKFPGGATRTRILNITLTHGSFKVTKDEIPIFEVAEETTPSPVPIEPDSSSTPEDTIRELVVFVRRSEAKRDLTGSMNGYAQNIEYFDKTRSFAEVRRDKALYFQKWPKLSETVVGPINVDFRDKTHAAVTFDSRFRVSNPKNGQWVTGDIENHYTLIHGSQGWKIVSQKGKVRNLIKSGNPKR